MADIIGSYERLPNDAVRAVAVAKRREYFSWADIEALPNSCAKDIVSTSGLEMIGVQGSLNQLKCCRNNLGWMVKALKAN